MVSRSFSEKGRNMRTRASLLDELRVLIYHPRFSSDGERGRKLASAFLGRELPHGGIDRLGDADASALLAHLREKLSDKGPAAVRKAVDHLANRP